MQTTLFEIRTVLCLNIWSNEGDSPSSQIYLRHPKAAFIDTAPNFAHGCHLFSCSGIWSVKMPTKWIWYNPSSWLELYWEQLFLVPWLTDLADRRYGTSHSQDWPFLALPAHFLHHITFSRCWGFSQACVLVERSCLHLSWLLSW